MREWKEQQRFSSRHFLLSLETVCANVASVAFHLTGSAAQMFLTLDDGASTQTVNTCAVMRNP